MFGYSDTQVKFSTFARESFGEHESFGTFIAHWI
jgi:hypothetical protein